MNAADTPIGYGYTLADLDSMARQACRYDRSLASDADTRYATAWSAIAETLAGAEHWPRRDALVRAGWQGIYREVQQMRRSFGFARDGGSSPRRAAYWYSPVASFEDDLVERHAVPTILATLTPSERAAVVALAVHGDYRLAAAAVGVPVSTFWVQLSRGRRRFRRRWFAPETAPPITSRDRRATV